MTSTPAGGRADGRADDELRPITFTRNWLDHAAGSVLVEFGDTKVLCAASVSNGVPRWRAGSGLGWVTAEYAMLPSATHTRGDRESIKGRVGGRTHEISRLIGRSLRACIDLAALGENTIALDCDVLQADGQAPPDPATEPVTVRATLLKVRPELGRTKTKFPQTARH